MRFGSVCSGIEAASVAWHPLGWRAQWFSEVDRAPSAVLAHRWPEVENLGDMRTIHETELFNGRSIDLLVGGTPCQSFSVAGFRESLDDPRGNLMLTYLALAQRKCPTWLVWENVPGVLSTHDNAFGKLLWGLEKLGYGFAHRILDAQYFGLAQRRRRVYVVGYLGDYRPAAAVLFDRESLSGNPAPSRQARKDVAPTLSARTKGGGGLGTDFDCDGGLIAHTLRGEGFDASEDGTGRGAPLVPVAFDTTQITSKTNRSQPQPGDPCHPLAALAALAALAHAPAIAFSCKDHGQDASEISPTLRAMNQRTSNANGGGQVAVATGHAVRRLTPRECERLQGFPDDYTLVPHKLKPRQTRVRWTSDSARYKMLGNSMPTTVISWIGRRIELVSQIKEASA